MRSYLAEDVLLAGYAGLMVGPVYWMTQWLAVTFGGTGGLAGHFVAQRYDVFAVGSLCVIWCAAHWILPFPALVVAVGIRLERAWSLALGRGLGLFLLLLPPIGSVLGIWLLFRLAATQRRQVAEEQG